MARSLAPVALVAAALLLAAAPAARTAPDDGPEAGPEAAPGDVPAVPSEAELLQVLRDRFGEVPATARLDGVEVPLPRALEALRPAWPVLAAGAAAAAPLPPALVEMDAGHAQRGPGDGACRFAAVIQVVTVRVFASPAAQEGFNETQVLAAPQATTCQGAGFGPGTATAALNLSLGPLTTRHAMACLDATGTWAWASGAPACQVLFTGRTAVSPLDAALLVGTVGQSRYVVSFFATSFVFEQVFAGVCHPTTSCEGEPAVMVLGSEPFPRLPCTLSNLPRSCLPG